MALHDWLISTPEAQGVDSQKLLDLLDYARAQRLNLHSLLIARSGRLVLEAYFHPYHTDSQHDMRSIAKSVTALLVGIALHEGKLTSLDQPVLSFFPKRTVAHRDVRKEAMTLRHLLNMSSGLALTDADTWHCLTEADALQWALDAPVETEPGAQMVYSSANYYLLSAVLQQATGQTLADYAQTKLFAPLGIGEVRWQSSQQGITLGWGGLWLASRDLAKLGALILADGQWNSVQLVPKAWIDTISRTQAENTNYGFGCWLDAERGAVILSGYGGQFCCLLPGCDLVLVLTAGLRDPSSILNHLMDTFVCPALHLNSLPENPEVAAELVARAAGLGRPQSRSLPPLPALAVQISGQRWQLDQNGLGLTAFTLTVQGSLLSLTLEAGEDRAVIPLAMDSVLRDVLVERLGGMADHDRMAAVGGWREGRTLVMHWYSINNPEYWGVAITFEGQQAVLRWEDVLSGYGETVTARQA
ncbi:MAG: serine hydrolase [Chloroflexi bacterium]|nr:serine hydrolase [Chloroflexota bacterium]